MYINNKHLVRILVMIYIINSIMVGVAYANPNTNIDDRTTDLSTAFEVQLGSNIVMVDSHVNAKKLDSEITIGTGRLSGRVFAPMNLAEIIQKDVKIDNKVVNTTMMFKPCTNPNSDWYGWYLPVDKVINGRPVYNESSHGFPGADSGEKYRVLTTLAKRKDKARVVHFYLEYFVPKGMDKDDASFKGDSTAYIYYTVYDNDDRTLEKSGYVPIAYYYNKDKKVPMFDIKSLAVLNMYYLASADPQGRKMGFKPIDTGIDGRFAYISDLLKRNTGTAQTAVDDDGNIIPIYSDEEGFDYDHDGNKIDTNDMTAKISEISEAHVVESAELDFEDKARIMAKRSEFDLTLFDQLLQLFEGYSLTDIKPSDSYKSKIDNMDGLFITPLKSKMSYRPNNVVLLDDLIEYTEDSFYIERASNRASGSNRISGKYFKVVDMSNPFTYGIFHTVGRMHYDHIIENAKSTERITNTNTMLYIDNYGNIVGRKQDATDNVEFYLILPNYLNGSFVIKPNLNNKFSNSVFVNPDITNNKIMGTSELENKRLVLTEIEGTSILDKDKSSMWGLNILKKSDFTNKDRFEMILYNIFKAKQFTKKEDYAYISDFAEHTIEKGTKVIVPDSGDIFKMSIDNYIYFRYHDSDPDACNELAYTITKDNKSLSSVNDKYLMKFQKEVILSQMVSAGDSRKQMGFVGRLISKTFYISVVAGILYWLYNSVCIVCWFLFHNLYIIKTDVPKIISRGGYNRDMTRGEALKKFAKVSLVAGVLVVCLYIEIVPMALTFISNVLSAIMS